MHTRGDTLTVASATLALTLTLTLQLQPQAITMLYSIAAIGHHHAQCDTHTQCNAHTHDWVTSDELTSHCTRFVQ